MPRPPWRRPRRPKRKPSPAACAGRCMACRSASRTSSTSRAWPRPAIPRSSTDNIAKADAVCVQKLRGAGAIVMGKLSTHEFAIGGPSFDLPWPPARNPWNTDHHPGGSSSGSGSGVAAGLFPMALGTDTGGSVRNPASCCGIVGLKPTYGLVSRRGVFPLSFTLDHIGPMTRTVADNALMLQAIAGHDAARSRQRGLGERPLCRQPRSRRARPAHRLRAPFPRGRHAGRARGHGGAGPCRARLADGGRRGARHPPADAHRVRRGQPRHPAKRGLGDPRPVAARAAGRLRPALAPPPDGRRLHERRRLRAGAAPAAGDDRRGRGGLPPGRRAAVRQLDGPALPHRPAGRRRAHLSAPGAHAVQRHRPSRARHAGRAVGRRPAACRCSSSAVTSRKAPCSRWRAPGSARPARTRSTRAIV